jgi:hypothetical protein
MAGLAKLPGIAGLGGTKNTPAAPAPKPPPISPTPVTATSLRVSRVPLRPRGPRALRLGQAREQHRGPGEPPAGFVTATTSAYEWVWYWASARKFSDPLNPREGPFTGSRHGLWEFQVAELPGAPRQPGSSVSDFLYHLPQGDLVIRLDTWFYHLTASPAQQARDLYLKLHAHSQGLKVITVYDVDFIGDPSGEAAVRLLSEALSGQERLSPVRGRNAYAVVDRVTGGAA